MARSRLPNKAHDHADAVRWQDENRTAAARNIAAEVPVSLTYNATAYVVMMVSPADLEDFSLGFSLSENIIAAPEDLLSLEITEDLKGYILNIEIPDAAYEKIADRRRHLAGRTGCGLCGTESLEEAIPDLKPVRAETSIAFQAVYNAFENLHGKQPEKQATGAVHGAAWCGPDGTILKVREDVGRHNALDKLIGAMAKDGLDFKNGFCLITSRCSYEMVQKAVQMNMPVLAAISAPTTLAVQMADENGLTLVALAREKTFTVFTHDHRIKQPTG